MCLREIAARGLKRTLWNEDLHLIIEDPKW